MGTLPFVLCGALTAVLVPYGGAGRQRHCQRVQAIQELR